MSETKKKTAAPKPVSKKPYLTGTPLDSSCIGGALRFFLYLLMMAIAFLFLGAVLSFDSFTRFFDTFCDNFFVDWMVQSQILQAQDRVEEARQRVWEAVQQLQFLQGA